MNVLDSVLMSTQSVSIAICLSCIAANRLVLSLRGLYYVNYQGDTTNATVESNPVYGLRALSQIRERDSTFSAQLEVVGVSVEEGSYTSSSSI
jgi:hypothetical protein